MFTQFASVVQWIIIMLELGVGLWCLTSLGVICNSSNCKNKLVLWYICLFICISIIAFKYIDRYINIARVSQIFSKFSKSKHGYEGKEKRLIEFVKLEIKNAGARNFECSRS